MQFINGRPEFKEYRDSLFSSSVLYYRGTFDQSVSSVFKTLDAGRFPTGLRGNFAFVFVNEKRVVGAVDHNANFNLFYNQEYVSNVFDDINDLTAKEKYWTVEWQKRIFWGGSVGHRTNNVNVIRLEPGTYFNKEVESGHITVQPYVDLYTHNYDPTIKVTDIADIIEQVVEEQTREPFNLFWSSGTDSNCILGFIRKLNRLDNCQLISLYSKDSITDERRQCEYLQQVYGINVDYMDLGKFIGVTDEVLKRVYDENESAEYKTNYKRTWAGFWNEPNLFQKYTTLYDMGIHTKPTLTGEVGDQIFGSRFGKIILNYLAHIPDPTTEDIAELFISADAFRFRRAGTQQIPVWVQSQIDDPGRGAGWNSAKEWTGRTWDKINTSGDNINKAELLQYMYKSSHRVYNYNHLVDCNFQHPFADYRLFHTIFKTPGHWKINNGETRRLSYEVIKDFVDPGPWKWPKSFINMPMQHAIQPRKP